MNAKYKVLSADDELWSRENIRRMLSCMSGCTPFGMVTPITRSRPRASTHSPATTELSFPPDMPMTALHPFPF